MRKKQKKFIIGLCIIQMIFLLNMNIVNAATSEISVQCTTNARLIQDTTIELLLYINEINVQPGIAGIQGKISYDKNIFEELKKDDLKTEGKWEVSAYTLSTQVFILLTNDRDVINNPGAVIRIPLKVKSGITATQTTINISDLIFTSGAETGDIPVDTMSITVSANAAPTYNFEVRPIPGEATPTPTPTTAEMPVLVPTATPTLTLTPTPTKTLTSTPTPTVRTSPSTQATPTPIPTNGGTEIPNTGESAIIKILGLIIVLIGIFSYVKYKRIKDIMR